MCMLSNGLVVFGLIFEFISVFWTVRKLFFGYHERINEKAKTFQQRIKRERIEGTIILGLLVLGMTFQGISVFV